MLNTEYINNHPAEEFWYCSKESVENAQKAICEFFDMYGSGSAQERLWEMLKLALGSAEINDWNEVKRANVIHFYELLAQLIKANYLLFLKMSNET
ncbi:hypothetical protein [Agriterribacter sp.]|uniref:hypothetical protein n=1 Tax=Agriterribacter sp. TaxID=2821509 RepID=UPI002CCA660B|nr:hypothetical protein [Agriterribacter sp.]HRO48291.1 hypothetical protein [Agriterribacter sp.]HRQ17150.1 hypothetical protein [Agriterribacter sp.]